MKRFIPMDEETILMLWMRNPKLVAPYSRPYYRRAASADKTAGEQGKGAGSKRSPSHSKEQQT